MRRRQQPIDDALVGVGRRCRRGRRRPPPASAAARSGRADAAQQRRLSPPPATASAAPARAAPARTRRSDCAPSRSASPRASPDDRLDVGPVLVDRAPRPRCRRRHRRALIDPGAQLRDGLRRQRIGVERHTVVVVRVGDPPPQLPPMPVARDDRGPDCPPFRIHSGACSRSWARAFERPWHSAQYFSKIG